MKQLLIMRHGKSVRAHRGVEDHDRPLTHPGREDAMRVGLLLAEEDLIPGRILSSTALRARQTALAVADACDFESDVDYLPELYQGGLDDYLGSLRALSDETERVLVVGHIPAVEDVVRALGGMSRDIPSGAVANIHLVIDGWPHVAPAVTGGLQRLWRPHELELHRLSIGDTMPILERTGWPTQAS